MAKKRDKDPVECVEKVGKYEFIVCFGEPTPESAARWDRRSDALFAWLMDRWKREQAVKARQAEGTRNGPSGQ